MIGQTLRRQFFDIAMKFRFGAVILRVAASLTLAPYARSKALVEGDPSEQFELLLADLTSRA
jgi:hypothetical protein